MYIQDTICTPGERNFVFPLVEDRPYRGGRGRGRGYSRGRGYGYRRGGYQSRGPPDEGEEGAHAEELGGEEGAAPRRSRGGYRRRPFRGGRGRGGRGRGGRGRGGGPTDAEGHEYPVGEGAASHPETHEHSEPAPVPT